MILSLTHFIKSVEILAYNELTNVHFGIAPRAPCLGFNIDMAQSTEMRLKIYSDFIDIRLTFGKIDRVIPALYYIQYFGILLGTLCCPKVECTLKYASHIRVRDNCTLQIEHLRFANANNVDPWHAIILQTTKNAS